MSPVTPAKPNKARPILRLKNPKRFLLQKEQQKDRLNKDWTRSRLIDELYLCLMSIKEKDDEGIRRRKYEEQIRKKMYWMPIPPHLSSVILVSLKDLDTRVKQELLKDDSISRDFTLKEAVGMICEQVDREFYLLSAKTFLKVRLEK